VSTFIQVDEAAGRITLVREDSSVELSPLWLRERSPDPDQCDPVTRQRLFDPHRLPDDLALTSIRSDGDTLELGFSDGYCGRFSTAALLADVAADGGLPDPVAWTAEQPPAFTFDWPPVRAGGPAFLEALEAFLTNGVVKLRKTPVEPGTILDVAGHFGWVRETNFGRLFEVTSRPASNDLAYRPVPLGPHTDNPYREPVPGIQILHCLVNETSGGLSTLVDGLAVSEALKAEDADGYALLATEPVGFHFADVEAEHYARRPIIHLDRDGVFEGIHYSPRLDRTPVLDPATMKRFHHARRRLGELLTDPRYELRFPLHPGELVMFDNNRVLHGRTGFDPSEGARHLQGCYIDREGPRSHYRVQRRRAPQTEEGKADRCKP